MKAKTLNRNFLFLIIGQASSMFGTVLLKFTVFKHKWVSLKPFIDEIDIEEYLATEQIETVLAGGENYLGSKPLFLCVEMCEKLRYNFDAGSVWQNGI